MIASFNCQTGMVIIGSGIGFTSILIAMFGAVQLRCVEQRIDPCVMAVFGVPGVVIGKVMVKG